jgi:hypothetical protein
MKRITLSLLFAGLLGAQTFPSITAIQPTDPVASGPAIINGNFDAIVTYLPFLLVGYTGSGAPAINCVAGFDIYTDITNQAVYFCVATNTWITSPGFTFNVTIGGNLTAGGFGQFGASGTEGCVHPHDTSLGDHPICATTTGITGVSPSYIPTEGGSNNAIAGSITGYTLAPGICANVQLAHTLQAGANTFTYNSGSAVAIKSHLNPANNIGTGYAATGFVSLCYNGTVWLDMAQ